MREFPGYYRYCRLPQLNTCQTVVELCVLVADGERGAAAYVPICWVGAP